MGLTYIQTPELNYGHLFSIDRVIRSTYKENSKAGWRDVAGGLENAGYSFLENPRDEQIFLFFRAWDEYLLNDGESFLVSFSETAAYELRNKLFLATPYPLFYTAVGSNYVGGNGRVLLVNQDHEPMYPDDMVWQDAEQTLKIAMGEVTLVQEQFPGESEYLKARDILLLSGYQVCDASGIWQAGKITI